MRWRIRAGKCRVRELRKPSGTNVHIEVADTQASPPLFWGYRFVLQSENIKYSAFKDGGMKVENIKTKSKFLKTSSI